MTVMSHSPRLRVAKRIHMQLQIIHYTRKIVIDASRNSFPPNQPNRLHNPFLSPKYSHNHPSNQKVTTMLIYIPKQGIGKRSSSHL
jgi:hypothetical protein